MIGDNTSAPAGHRFDFREHGDGWCVFDNHSNSIVSLQGRDQIGLCLDAADELAAALNRAAVLRAEVRP